MNYSAQLINSTTIKVIIDDSNYENKDSFYLSDDRGFREKLTISSITKKGKLNEYILESSKIKLPCELYIYNCMNFKTPLLFDLYVKTKEFNDQFHYEGNDLGPYYTPDKTTFKLFAPISTEVIICIEKDGGKINFDMNRRESGIYETTINFNLDGAKYSYLVKNSGSWIEATDPYAYSSTGNGRKSIVINQSLKLVKRHNEKLSNFKNYVDAIIYELHVRDFSISKTSNIKNKGKFLAFMERNTKNKKYPTGIDYLKDLGVTHIQLLPIFDFDRVDEYNQLSSYNWGYDPSQYNVPEGSYATDVDNPYSRIIECQEMIESIHNNGMRVNMDVVYNHVFAVENSSFNKIVPYYYFRTNKDGKLSNGSFCGNDFDTLMPMARKFIIDSCLHWVNFYNVDGFRFDLMGILDYPLINEIYEKCVKIKPEFMVYGEGWSMPTLLDKKVMATISNSANMPNVAFFSDRFRDITKGSNFNVMSRGYITNGDVDMGRFKQSMLGASLNESNHTLSPNNTINYLECHDNHTLWDKLSICLDYESSVNVMKRQKLGLGIILLSQGIPLLHAGMEFARTKQGDDNSYMSNDEINNLDYDLMVKNHELVEYTKKLIEFRKKHQSLRLTNIDEINKKIEIVNDGKVIFYRLKEEKLLIVINPLDVDYYMAYEHEVIFNECGNKGDITNKIDSLTIKIFKE